jgi:dipeptidyl aminopeptidase/acylaminoacyl peptidase
VRLQANRKPLIGTLFGRCSVVVLFVATFGVEVFPQQAASDPELAPLPLNALFSMPKIAVWGPIALSPDGQLVVYPVCVTASKVVETDARYKDITRSGAPSIFEGCELKITNTQTRETTTLLTGGNSWFPVWSPNGQKVAFYSDHDSIANLWIWNRTTRKAGKVSPALIRSGARSEPQWMTDGNGVVATILPHGMTLDEAASMALGESVRIDPAKTSTQSSVVVYTAGAGDKNTTKGAAFDTSKFFSDLVLFDLGAETSRPIESRKKIWGFHVSPDGKSVAFTTEAGFKSSASHLIVYDLHIYDLATSQTRNVANDIGGSGGRSYSWSPDSRNIAYCAKDCFIVSRDGGDPRNVTPGEHPSFSHVDRLPLWDARGENLYVLSLASAELVARGYAKAGSDGVWRIDIKEPSVRKVARIPGRTIIDVALSSRTDRVISADSGRSLILLAIDDQTKRTGLYRVDLATGSSAVLREKDEVLANGTFFPAGYAIDLSADGTTIVYLVQDSQHPPELYISDAQFKNTQPLSKVADTLKQFPMGKSKLIDWRGYDGKLYRGLVLLPSGYREGRAYPTIVYPYPGESRSEWVNVFGMSVHGAPVENMQVFASRGYVVFMPDTPGPEVGRPMHSLVEGILPAVNKIIDLGIADPNRMGVMGHSYGGYMVLSCIVQTKRFKAAVARSGSYDLAAEYGYMMPNGATFAPAWAESGQGSMGGTPWEFRERYIENSPFFYLDRVETPLLLIHGSADGSLAPFTADQVFVGLRRLEKRVEYAKYIGEEHTESGWGYANQLDYLNRVIAWFDKYLKPNAEKTSSKANTQR